MHWKTGVTCKPSATDLDVQGERQLSDSCEMDEHNLKDGNFSKSHYLERQIIFLKFNNIITIFRYWSISIFSRGFQYTRRHEHSL